LILGVKSSDSPSDRPLRGSTVSAASQASETVSNGCLRASAAGSPLRFSGQSNAPSDGSRRKDSLKGVEFFVASDAGAIVEHTRQVMHMEDHDMLHFSNGIFVLYNCANDEELTVNNRALTLLELELNEVSKGTYSHFMLKEIFEQVSTVQATMAGRVDFEKCSVKLGGLQAHIQHIRRSRKLTFIACGTSYHSAVASRAIFEELTQLAVCIELASDFQDRRPPVFRDDCFVFLSQSGETADTLQALEYCKSQNALCIGVTNTAGSSIARATDCGVYLNCGPEIGVASTKAYTSQIIALILIALQLGADTESTRARREHIIKALQVIHMKVAEALKLSPRMVKLAEKLYKEDSLLVMGRGYQYATCLEAALKIKEIPYMHCEAVLAGELKHGPLALVEDTMPIIFVATKDALLEKSKNALSQIQARGGKPTIFCTEGDTSFESGETIIRMPSTVDCLQGLLNIIPLQLLSFHLAIFRKHNVDQPRNLAKSVTVG